MAIWPLATSGDDTRTASRSCGRMADGFDFDRLAFEAKVAHQDAFPESQRLANFRQIFGLGAGAVGLGEAETEPAEVEAVRIGPQPGDFGRAAVARDVGVADLAAVGVELAEVELFDRPAVRIGSRVPAPMGERAERDRLVVRFGKGLQAGHVGRKRELAVADREGRFRIELGRSTGLWRETSAWRSMGSASAVCAKLQPTKAPMRT